MRKIIIIIFLLIFYNQSNGQSRRNQKSDSEKIEKNLTQIENTIISIFLNTEFKKARYKNYKNLELFMFQEAIKSIKSIDSYEYSLRDWNDFNKWKELNRGEKEIDSNKIYFLKKSQIDKIRLELGNEPPFYWKVSDFNGLIKGLYNKEELRAMTNNGSALKIPKRLIIHLSKPLIINKNNAFLSFHIGIIDGLPGTINHSTVLFRKKNGIWQEIGQYEDGVFY